MFKKLIAKIFCRYVHIIDRYSKLKNNEEIHQTKMILDFIKKQVTPKPISLYDAINVLMNDFATQQNVIMELLIV